MSAAALDPSYAEAAARRAAGGPIARVGERQRLVALLVLVGVGTGVAGAQVRQRADEIGASRRALLADVQERTRATDRLAAEADVERADVREARALALGTNGAGQRTAEHLASLELASGAVAVIGPGLVVTLNDATGSDSGADARGGQAGDGRIFDRDIQDVVNALWAAGAEAISVNDQRVTAQTAIRSAGEAVLVDLRPLSPPYVLRAIGDVDRMEPAFVDGPTARKFTTWTSLYGLGFDVSRASSLRLPAAGAPDLRLARTGGSS